MSPVLQLLLDHAIQLVFLFAAPILLKLVNDWMKAKGLNNATGHVHDILSDAVAYAEQTALAKVRAGGTPVPGNEKLNSALAFAQTEVKRLKLPEIASDHLTKMIEASLFHQQPSMQEVATSKTMPPPAPQENSTETTK